VGRTFPVSTQKPKKNRKALLEQINIDLEQQKAKDQNCK